MGRSTLLILGLVVLLLLGLLCLTCHHRGIEADLMAGGGSALEEAGLEWAGLRASGCVLTLTGTPPDAGSAEAALDLVRRLPGVCRVEDGTAAMAAAAPAAREPYRFAASRADAGLRLEGSVPDETVRSAIVDRAGEIVGADNVVDELDIRVPAPKGDWAEAALSLLGSLDELAEGKGSLTDRRLEVTGIAGSSASADAVRLLVGSGLPEGYEGSLEIAALGETTEVDAGTCQRLFVALMRDNEIRFATASSTIERSSFALLDHLVAVTRRCPASRVEISGHTDSRGTEDRNLDLSRRRAEAVRSYLASKGASPERLTSVGFGEARPIGDNSTAAGRARNRRIEFEIL